MAVRIRKVFFRALILGKTGKKTAVIGCKVLEGDFRIAAERLGLAVDFVFLDSRLHEDAADLQTQLQLAISEASARGVYSRLILGYGVCGKGTAGLVAAGLPLVIAQAQDCISFFLGSDSEYRRQFSANPGTYYISAGLCADGADPMHSMQNYKIFSAVGDMAELVNKYGKDNAEYLTEFFGQWHKNYNRVVLIDNGTKDSESADEYARKLAEQYHWQFWSRAMNYHLIDKLLTAEASDDEILFVPAGEKIVFDELSGKITAVKF